MRCSGDAWTIFTSNISGSKYVRLSYLPSTFEHNKFYINIILYCDPIVLSHQENDTFNMIETSSYFHIHLYSTVI